jgi:hypothetical protein
VVKTNATVRSVIVVQLAAASRKGLKKVTLGKLLIDSYLKLFEKVNKTPPRHLLDKQVYLDLISSNQTCGFHQRISPER